MYYAAGVFLFFLLKKFDQPIFLKYRTTPVDFVCVLSQLPTGRSKYIRFDGIFVYTPTVGVAAPNLVVCT